MSRVRPGWLSSAGLGLSLAIALQSCAAPAPAATSLCQTTRSVLGWQGVDVRWTGMVIGTPEHGYVLVATGCRRRGIALDWHDARRQTALKAALRREWQDPGIVLVELSGKVSGLLRVKKVHRIAFVRMSPASKDHLLRTLGY